MKTVIAIVALLCAVCVAAALNTKDPVDSPQQIQVPGAGLEDIAQTAVTSTLKIGSLDSTEKNGATNVNYNGNTLGLRSEGSDYQICACGSGSCEGNCATRSFYTCEPLNQLCTGQLLGYIYVVPEGKAQYNVNIYSDSGCTQKAISVTGPCDVCYSLFDAMVKCPSDSGDAHKLQSPYAATLNFLLGDQRN